MPVTVFFEKLNYAGILGFGLFSVTVWLTEEMRNVAG